MRTCFVIPAHDEASLIGGTVQVLAGLADAVYVIADHCSDATARMAAEAGAIVYERHQGAGGKGAALAWFVDVAGEVLQAYDFLVMLDADSRPGVGFVPAMADAFRSGAVAAQGFVLPVGAGRSPTSALAAYSELLSQRIGDKIRARLGWTVPLRGKAMAFRPSVLCALASSLRTRTEDIEMSLWLARNGVRVHSVPRALAYDPAPADAHWASSQRARWLYGQMQVWRRYWRDILALALTGGPSAWSLLWAVLIKPKTLLFAAKVGAFAIALVLWLARLGPAWFYLLAGLIGLSLAVDVGYYLVGLLLVEDRRFYARALLAAPFYLVVWLRSALLVGVAKGTWLRARD